MAGPEEVSKDAKVSPLDAGASSFFPPNRPLPMAAHPESFKLELVDKTSLEEEEESVASSFLLPNRPPIHEVQPDSDSAGAELGDGGEELGICPGR